MKNLNKYRNPVTLDIIQVVSEIKRILIASSIFMVGFAGLANAQDNNPSLGIIPAPVLLKKSIGTFMLSQQTTLLADSVMNKAVVFFQDYLLNKGMLKIKLKPNSGLIPANSIVLTSQGADKLPPDGYILLITPQKITITGRGAGLFYGIQSLIQLMPGGKAGAASLPCVEIEDYPRFKYRGLMLDVCRHFFSVEFVKRYIDLMAAYKVNNFHWHLTDDQGWRIEIKKYPKLTQVSSLRAQTVIGDFHDRTPQQYDNTPYGGFYTQDQIREVVKYASARYVNIIPEIEMPGHSEAVFAAYPELSCNPSLTTYKVAETWGIFHNIYCPSEQTFDFLQNVLTEVMDLFPGKYIHIGGDEAPKDAWKKSEFCQKLIKKLGLKDEEELQSYFIQRIEKFVNSKGRNIIGWDEILEGGLSPNATVMSWRGEAGGIAAARQNHHVIMTPGSAGLYIDQLQGKQNIEPLNNGGNAPLDKIYRYNPIPAELTSDQQKYIQGVQANLWAEYIATEKKAEYMILPRMLALSEVGWTSLSNKNFADFTNTRLPSHLAWLDKNNFNYRVPAAIGSQDTIVFGSQLNVNLTSPVNGAKIYFTIDGYPPRETDMEYTVPMHYNVPAGQYRELKTIVITPSGKRSQVTHTVMYNQLPFEAINYNGTSKGLKYRLYTGGFTSTNQLKDEAVIDSGVSLSFNTSAFKNNMKGFGLLFNGFIHIDADDVYGFSTSSANGSVLLIDNQPVVDNDGKHGLFDQGGAVPLKKGYHKITIKYFDATSSGNLKVFISATGKPKSEINPAMLFY
ncbi:Beta-hexosaminidase [Arcticibacter svalbardensis MN12-7]|uniref:beta-N-acetylhexosaminidase n=1 Tax=Arcticibacter svalbardensis MN12-7 TaxID=1150600 RepID=R9H6I6_9SPHI|nr:family 20 glycosylhydrolase [Arcticibacter svalbardensis]EOR96779.1 Beta-hexosaminidase [Arcticibacter svalbardensis MN12-7]